MNSWFEFVNFQTDLGPKPCDCLCPRLFPLPRPGLMFVASANCSKRLRCCRNSGSSRRFILSCAPGILSLLHSGTVQEKATMNSLKVYLCLFVDTFTLRNHTFRISTIIALLPWRQKKMLLIKESFKIAIKLKKRCKKINASGRKILNNVCRKSIIFAKY